MKVKFSSQPESPLSVEIKNSINEYRSISIASAYLTEDGLKVYEKDLLSKEVRILCGVHGCISDLHALSNFVNRSSGCIKGNVFTGSNVFHLKLYIFSNVNDFKMIIGSANFTYRGMNLNEEAFVVITGDNNSQPILNAMEYYDHLWNNNSLPVEKYLEIYPDYKVNVNLNDKLSEKHITIINSIQESFNNSNTITFRKSINDTLYNHGKQTIPAAFDQKLDQWGLCAVGQSIKFSVILLDNSKVQGQLYHGRNNTGLYYQLMVSGFSNAKRLRDLIKSENLLSLNYEINLSDRSIIIKKAA